MGGVLDPDTWRPPELLPSADAERLKGTLHGTRLYEQPEHRAFAAGVRAFCSREWPLNLEIGVDKGYRVMAHARRWPDQLWLGVELRRRVQASIGSEPDGCMLMRGDARAVLATLVPVGRLQRVDILFPTPSDDPGHLLLTPAFARLLSSRLAPGGLVHVATDVPGLAELARSAFQGWREAPHPASGPVRSRREKVCEREGRRVWRWTWLRTEGPTP